MFLLGQAVGKYQVLSNLGSGGFGTVFLAKDAWIDKKVAIKVPHRQSGDFSHRGAFDAHAYFGAAGYHRGWSNGDAHRIRSGITLVEDVWAPDVRERGQWTKRQRQHN